MSEARDWIVTYRGHGRAPVEVWAIVEGVPGALEVDDVSTALELWERWPAWQARVRPGATVNIRKRTKRDEALTVEGVAVTVLPWSTLAPTSRRVQVELPGPLYAACRRAARAEGVSLARWVTHRLAEAAAVDLASLEVDGPPVRRYVDVPLPLIGGAE